MTCRRHRFHTYDYLGTDFGLPTCHGYHRRLMEFGSQWTTTDGRSLIGGLVAGIPWLTGFQESAASQTPPAY